MHARWGSFAVGVGLLLAPLAVGYPSPAPILHDVAMGSLVCIATVAALEWPRARFTVAAPGLWLVAVGTSTDGPAALVDLVAGLVVVVLSAVPSRGRSRALPGVSRSARARA